MAEGALVTVAVEAEAEGASAEAEEASAEAEAGAGAFGAEAEAAAAAEEVVGSSPGAAGVVVGEEKRKPVGEECDGGAPSA